MVDLMKRRGGRSFGNAARGRTGGGQSGQGQGGQGRRRGIVEGRYERWQPGELALWVHLPEQSYTYEVYDRDEKAVILQENWPYLEYVDHFVPPGNSSPQFPRGMGFVCSCGARRDKPCYGCKRRVMHFAHLDEVEETTGVRPQEWAPIGKSNRFALSAVVMEKILQIPKVHASGKDKGKVKKTRKGQTIYDYVPLPVAGMDNEEIAKLSMKFGHRAHWSFGQQHLGQLLDFDEKLRNNCANCASALICLGFICPECETPQPLPELVSGEDLYQARNAPRKCSACGYRYNGPEDGDAENQQWVADLDCADCGTPREGKLLGCFDLRLKAKKAGGEKKAAILDIVSIRVTNHDDEEIAKLVQNPLKLLDIFEPSTLDDQKRIISKELWDGVDPMLEQTSEAYSGNEEQDGDEDLALPGNLAG
jgi:hypothetical protein